MGGMGGGFFDVADEVSLEDAKTQPANGRPQAIKIKPAEGQTLTEAWDAYFQQPLDSISEADVRHTLRRQMGFRRVDDVVTIIQSALRNGYVRPWMYEALGLAMQAAESPRDEIERAIMSAVDLTADQGEVMMAATYLARQGFDQRALKLFQEVSESNPLRPEPYLRGLEIANRLNDLDGIRWATTSILKQAWPEDQKHIETKALRIAKGKLQELMSQSSAEADEFRVAMTDALVRDCVVKITWTGDADLDTIVEEPGGTVCSLRNPRTTSGGVLHGDAFAHESNEGKQISETYSCPEGFSGVYRMLVRRVWGDVTAGKVTVDIYTNRFTPEERHIRKQIPLADKDALIIFDVPDGRRKAAFTEEQVTEVASTKIAANRAVLAQQLNQVTESEAVTNLAIARSRGLNNGFVPFLRNRGAVGFRPELTLLPEGANLISATAVISADRRYVRFSGLPFFSTIGEVQTFNFASGDTGTDGGGLGGGGLGGGGLGGGLGGGF